MGAVAGESVSPPSPGAPPPQPHRKGIDRVDGPPTLRVFSADDAASVSKQNALHAINLLLFEIILFTPKERGAANPEQTALPPLLRRAGGSASLFTLCVLYAAISRKLGVPLEIVRFSPPPVLSSHGPAFLLRFPAADEQHELYVDIMAAGRLRSTRDLSAFIDSSLPQLSTAQVRGLLQPLDSAAVCAELAREMQHACLFGNMIAQAAFWKVQRAVLSDLQSAAHRDHADSVATLLRRTLGET